MACNIGLAKAGIGPEKWKTYIDNREKFQIDLGIDLLNRALKLAFEELEEGEDRPDFMRKHPFVPCDCDQCYFCKNNYTNGIAHADRMVAEYGDKSSGKRKRVVTECDEDRVVLARLKGGQECKVCMDRLKAENPDHSYKVRRSNAGRSRMGCRLCDQPVCDDCWPKYEHPYNQRNK